MAKSVFAKTLTWPMNFCQVLNLAFFFFQELNFTKDHKQGGHRNIKIQKGKV